MVIAGLSAEVVSRRDGAGIHGRAGHEHQLRSEIRPERRCLNRVGMTTRVQIKNPGREHEEKGTPDRRGGISDFDISFRAISR